MFGIADDILITCFDDMSRDHDAALNKVLRICRQANIKLKKDKCLFRCTGIPFYSEVISPSSLSLDPRKVQALMSMPLPKCKKELQLLINYSN